MVTFKTKRRANWFCGRGAASDADFWSDVDVGMERRATYSILLQFIA